MVCEFFFDRATSVLRYAAFLAFWFAVLLFAGHANADDDANNPIVAIVQLLDQVDAADFQSDVLKGLHEALRGRRDVKMPVEWPKVYRKLSKSESAAVRDKALVIALIFRDEQAIRQLQSQVLNKRLTEDQRRGALHSLIENGIPNLAPMLNKLLADDALRRDALRGMASYPQKDTAEKIVALYSQLNDLEKQAALDTLSSRAAFAFELLDAIERKTISQTDVSTVIARQIQQLGNEQVKKRLAEVWGVYARPREKKKN